MHLRDGHHVAGVFVKSSWPGVFKIVPLRLALAELICWPLNIIPVLRQAANHEAGQLDASGEGT